MKIKSFIMSIFALILLVSLVVMAHESDKEFKVSEAVGTVYYLDSKVNLKNPPYFVNGRLYLPLNEFVTKLGGTCKTNDTEYNIEFNDESFSVSLLNYEKLKSRLFFIKQTAYMSSYDISKLMNLWPVFDGKENSVTFYNEEKKEPYIVDTATTQKAYIRFEDIAFDNGLSHNFSDENLERLRAISNYLWEHGHSFYIAWIPLYVNPPQNIVNDITETFSFYNADYIHTLDYMTDHNGTIVLHGLTHQENETVSAVGTEFGSKSPFSIEEVYERMIKAKEIADTYGYEDSIFEFPHYACTEQQIEIAEQLFDIIYQPCMNAKDKNKIFEVKRENKTVKYLPTPLGYIKKEDEPSAIVQRIAELPPGSINSMFFHPFMDYSKIEFSVSEDGVRSYKYAEDAKLVKLLQEMENKNIYFSKL